MITKNAVVEKITLEEPIHIQGLSLVALGMPGDPESLGRLWGKFRDRGTGDIPNQAEPAVQVAAMTGSDYIVGCQVTAVQGIEDLVSVTLPAGEYVKGSFSAGSFEELVEESIITIWDDMQDWARENGIALNDGFAAEVYPQDTVNLEHPSMYCLYPIEGTNL